VCGPPIDTKGHRVQASCKRHQVDPIAYLKVILERLPTHGADRLGVLFPDAWSQTHPHARRTVAS
jgi:IS66 C-terminal element